MPFRTANYHNKIACIVTAQQYMDVSTEWRRASQGNQAMSLFLNMGVGFNVNKTIYEDQFNQVMPTAKSFISYSTSIWGEDGCHHALVSFFGTCSVHRSPAPARPHVNPRPTVNFATPPPSSTHSGGYEESKAPVDDMSDDQPPQPNFDEEERASPSHPQPPRASHDLPTETRDPPPPPPPPPTYNVHDDSDIIVELFSGSGSGTKAMTPEFLTSISRNDRPIKIVSLDISDKYHTPTIKTDLMEWDYKKFCDVNQGQILYIHGSPPCSPHSSSNTRKHLDTPYNHQQKALSKALWGRVRDIINYAKPAGYSLENPWTSDVLKYLDEWYPNEPLFKNRTRGDYCAYGFLYQKKTLWITPKPINLKECPGNKKCHATYFKIATKRWCHIKGVEDLSKLEERYSMPLPLIRSIFSQVLEVSWTEEVDNLKPQGAGTAAQLGAGYTTHGEEEMSENTYNTPGQKVEESVGWGGG